MIKLSASVSKKVPVPGIDYSSRSCSAGAEVEVAGGATPKELKDRFRALYRSLDEAVEEQLSGEEEPSAGRPDPGECRETSGRPDAGGNGSARPATEAQVRAIYAIASDRGLNEAQLEDLVRERHGAADPSSLSLKEASHLIDYLKNGRRAAAQ